MKTVTIDILQDKALDLLRDLESLKIIRLHRKEPKKNESPDLVRKYKGAMLKQDLKEVDQVIPLFSNWSKTSNTKRLNSGS